MMFRTDRGRGLRWRPAPEGGFRLSLERAPGVRRIAVLFREQHRDLDDALVAIAGFRAHRGAPAASKSTTEVDADTPSEVQIGAPRDPSGVGSGFGPALFNRR